LNKPGKLTDEEFRVMRRHPQLGAEFVKQLRGFDTDILDGIMYHQEKWDGSGYPKGLKQEEIPPLARIAAVIDSFHAMISKRVYTKVPKSPLDAAEELIRCRGSQFDPVVVDAFVELLREKGILKHSPQVDKAIDDILKPHKPDK